MKVKQLKWMRARVMHFALVAIGDWQLEYEVYSELEGDIEACCWLNGEYALINLAASSFEDAKAACQNHFKKWAMSLLEE